VQAPTPTHLIDGGLPIESVVVHMLVDKYADHQPLLSPGQAPARQGMFNRSIDISFLAHAMASKGCVPIRDICHRRGGLFCCIPSFEQPQYFI
jgi:hypothetical protein